MAQLFRSIRCDNLHNETLYHYLNTDICGIDRVKYVITSVAIFGLLVGCIYLRKKYERCHKTLLTFHNLRAAVSLLLLAINSLELARSLLPRRNIDQLNGLFVEPSELNVLIVIGAGAIWNSLAAILLTIMLMSYHRVVERKKARVFLSLSVTVEVIVSALRIYEYAEVVYYEDFFELESCLDGTSLLCLMALAGLDGYTIYKERYRPDYLEDYDKIGYKHTLATFYSKSCFWWLTPLLKFGYSMPLELEDLGQMRLEDSARAHYDHFLLNYKTEKVKKGNAAPSLWYCYIKNSWRMFALGVILKLAGDLFALIGPLAIQQIVQYIEELYADAQTGHISMAGEERATNQIAPNALDAHDVTADDEVFGIGIGDVRIYYARWSDLVTNGWSIAWIVLLAALTQAALSQASTHVLNMTGIRIKTSLQGLIYRKTLLLNASSGCINNGGDNDAAFPAAAVQQNGDAKLTAADDKPAEAVEESGLNDIGAITNLMTEDTQNVMQFFWLAHYAWAIPFKISVVIYLLYLKLGISAVIGAIVCILIMTPLQFLIGNAMSKNAEVIAKYTDERLRKIHDTLIGIKIIKLNAWTDVFLKKINQSREKELKYLNKDAFYWALMTILTHVSTVLITFVTLAVYVCLPRDSKFSLDASHLFSALALFQQLTVPLLIFPITVPIIIAARVSTRRLERFLTAREITKQFEGIRNMARILSKSDASLDMYETQEKSNMTMRTAQVENQLNEQRLALRIRIPEPTSAPLAQSEPITPLLQGGGDHVEEKTAAPFSPLSHSKLVQQRRELLRNNPYVAIRPPKLCGATVEKPVDFSIIRARNTDSWRRDSLLLKMSDDIAVSINNGLFAWQPQSEHKLHVPEIALPKGKLTIIVGKNGAGKTSLLSALLMEMPLVSGNMFWHKTSTISYVPQEPWLLNASIRENILFGECYRPKRFEFVLDACALKPDIELMPNADFTIIGERGINLSGGQRQRIAIARAIYSSANVVIMDDPLSSLDNEVGRHVFEQCVRQMLLKSNRTIILVTQQLQLIREADYLIVMKDGRLQACGSYKDIELKQPHIITKWNSIIAKANSKDQQQNSGVSQDCTARERWKLFKNVSKLGLQRSISVTSETGNMPELDAPDAAVSLTAQHVEVDAAGAGMSADDDDDELPSSLLSRDAGNMQHVPSFKLRRKRSSVYGSRHLIYDMPLPIDECQTDDVIMRPRRRVTLQRRPSSSSRASNSWHRLSGLSTATATSTSSASSGDLLRRSVLTASCSSYASSHVDAAEQSTTATPPEVTELRVQSWQPHQNVPHQPLTRNASSPPAIAADVITDLESSSVPYRGGFQQFLRRMSMRRSNKPKLHHRPLSATNSILSISEESSASALLPTIELSAVSSLPPTPTPAIELTKAQTTTNWLASLATETETASSASSMTPALPRKHVNIDYKALPTNGCNNNNNNDDAHKSNNSGNDKENDIDVPNVTHLQPGVTTTAIATATATTKDETPGARTTNTRVAACNDAERKYGQISHHIYLLYIRASGLPIIIVFFITALIWQCLRVYTDIWLQNWSDHVTNMEIISSSLNSSSRSDNMPDHEVTYYFYMYATISCVCIIMAMISTPAGQWAGCNARRNLHDKLLQTILHKTLHFFQVTPLGRIVNRFSNDMAIIDKKIAATSQRLLQFTLLCLCAILINVSVTPWFLALTLPICGAYYVIQKFYRCSARELQRIENSTNSPVISHLSETIQGVTTIRAYNQEARFTEILFKRLEANTIAFTILNTSSRWLGISLDYLGGCIVFAAIVTALVTASVSCTRYAKEVASFAINKNGSKEATTALTPTPSLVGLAINYTLLVPIYLNWVVRLLADMEMYAGSVERIAHYAQLDEHTAKLATENSNEVDSSSTTSSSSSSSLSLLLLSPPVFDKVCPGATPAAVDVDGDVDVDVDADADVDSDKLNATNAKELETLQTTKTTLTETLPGATNQPNLHTAMTTPCASTVVDKLQANSVASSLTALKDKKVAALGDKVNLPNEPARRRRLRMPVKRYQSVPISWPQRGDISFENVSLRYEGQSQNVIKDLTLVIPAGQRIGICGRTGSGKSSLALSLFGVLQTTSGQIRIDDVDIETILPDELRTRLSIIPQDVHLFNATIRENLDPHGYYSDLQLWNCLELAQLKEFVKVQLPQGLDTEITDGGINLSAGHRQLLCLARAILRGSVCLVLDEATSTLDSSTERALLRAADTAFKGRTIIAIAHRLSTILDYERIIVLDQGQIVEDGNPRQLQEQTSSIFYRLLHTAAGDELGLPAVCLRP